MGNKPIAELMKKEGFKISNMTIKNMRIRLGLPKSPQYHRYSPEAKEMAKKLVRETDLNNAEIKRRMAAKEFKMRDKFLNDARLEEYVLSVEPEKQQDFLIEKFEKEFKALDSKARVRKWNALKLQELRVKQKISFEKKLNNTKQKMLCLSKCRKLGRSLKPLSFCFQKSLGKRKCGCEKEM